MEAEKSSPKKMRKKVSVREQALAAKMERDAAAAAKKGS